MNGTEVLFPLCNPKTLDALLEVVRILNNPYCEGPSEIRIRRYRA